MQINRLFEIVYILLEKKTVTADELAKRFEVSTRTIYRDIDTLSVAKIPVYASKGRNGGISLLDDFVLNKALLTEEEQNQILFSIQSLNKLNDSNEKSVLEKMSTIFNKEQKNWIDIDFSNWGTDVSQNKIFNNLKKGILKCQVVEFTYYNSYGKEDIRKIEPLQICFKDKSWYVKGYCRLKQDYRIFKISRIKNIKLLEENFERDLPEQVYKKQDLKKVLLELEISKDMSYRVYDEFSINNIVEKGNGDFIVKVEYPENDWLYGYILSFGENAKVLSPEYIKTIIKCKIEKTFNNYL
jgi:predicted DNA-binding transcriptional regulator YafY